MAGNIHQTYRYLDTQEDREALLDDIRQVRQSVLDMRDIVPPDQWYEPRYHNWSLAAMLGHLQLLDTLSLWQIKAALVGLPLPISSSTMNSFNQTIAQVFRRRMVESTVRGIENGEKHIRTFILQLPVDRFTVQVFYPPINKYLTVEQAIQTFFLHHWQEHLRTMQKAEGLYYEPPDETAL